MTKDQIREIEELYQKLGIPKDVPLRTTLPNNKINGYFSTRSTVSKGKIFSSYSQKDNKS